MRTSSSLSFFIEGVYGLVLGWSGGLLLDQLLGFAVGLLRFGKTGKSIFSSFLLFIYCFVFPILYSVFN
jgi:hypothetical protein